MSLRKRPQDKQWWVRVSLGKDPETGRYRTRDIPTGKTNRAEARKVEASIIADLQKGAPIEATRETFSQLAARFMAERGAANLAPQTYRSYDCELRNHILPAIGDSRVTAIRPDALSKLYADAAEAGLAQSHCLYLHRIVHRILGWAMKQKLIAFNVADMVEAPKVRRAPRQVLTEAQTQAVLAAVRGTPLYAAYWIALETGLRAGEIVARRWSDLDTDRGVMSVRTQLQRVDKGERTASDIIKILSETKKSMLVERPTKANRPRSTVSLSAQAFRVLAARRHDWEATREAAGTDWDCDDWISCFEDGRPMDPSYLSHHWVKLRERVGIPGTIHLHDLRHTSASIGLAHREDIKAISERLGHSDVGITLRLYAHLMPDAHHDAAERRSAALGDPEAKRQPERKGDARDA